jgi:CRP/FNR family transcriptional regulator
LLGRKTATERIANFLVLLAERADRLGGEKARVVDFAMSRADIADYLGLTKETVSRIFSAFRARRLIRLVKLNKVEILDRAVLQQVAEGEG